MLLLPVVISIEVLDQALRVCLMTLVATFLPLFSAAALLLVEVVPTTTGFRLACCTLCI